ncbi:hypothetical protein RI138_26455 [Streptomyces sp. C11-1]|uniref:Uncharacterized protein n=1 Tax=Streptomyces durocortorensis TaxID=2811104 RepID=A0ABY9W288_9ACTN|nr:hypothetical protein [Streptomyces durocortorensis]WNF30088.1 hypothetical protein RI138_26455 [Streptomyces durocortorensis]
MDLRTGIGKMALARPAVLIAPGRGATRERLAVEAELARRAWPQAAGPASADLVVFAGAPLPVREGDWAERLWQGVPGPKALVTITDAGHAAHALDHVHAALLEAVAQPARHMEHTDHRQGHAPAPQHRAGHDNHEQHGGHDGPGGYHEGGDHTGHDPHRAPGHMADGGGTDHPHMSHDATGHDRMGHGAHGHHMGTIAGLPLAERADDRDGLRLDRLHVPLGPALPDWPAGLVLHLELQGDVVQRAEVETVPAPSPSRPAFWNEPWLRAMTGDPVTVGEAARRRCAAHLDSLGRLLGVAGWRESATRARVARDRTLDGAPGAELHSLVRPLARRVRRSWTLRWLTAGVGERVGGQPGGDVHRRLIAWLDGLDQALGHVDDRDPLSAHHPVGPRGRLDTQVPPSQALLEALPELLEGTEYACARLIVASLDPDLDELAPQHVPGAHGHG